MLGWISIGNTGNLPYDTSGKLIVASAPGNVQRFEDRASTLAFTVSKNGQDETMPGVRRIVFGSANSETLTGAEVSDRLFGAGGDDNLIGRQGNDYFEGGIGSSGASNCWDRSSRPTPTRLAPVRMVEPRFRRPGPGRRSHPSHPTTSPIASPSSKPKSKPSVQRYKISPTL